MTLALPVSAEPELYFGDVTELADGSKVVSLMVRDVDNLGACDANIKFTTSEGVVVEKVTSGDGNALTLKGSNVDDTEGSMIVMALAPTSTSDSSTGLNGAVVICDIKYTGSDSNPFEVAAAQLYNFDSFDQIIHNGNNKVDRPTPAPTPTTDGNGGGGGSGGIPESTEIVDENLGLSDTNGDNGGGIPESTEIVDETNGSSGEDNDGIPGFGLLTGLSVMLIAVRLLREDK